MFFVKQFIILMKQIFIFGTDKTFTVIFFSVLHDVITYGVGIFIDESSTHFLVHKQYAFVVGKLKQIIKHPTYFICSCMLPRTELLHNGSIIYGCSLTNLHKSLCQFFYSCKEFLIILVLTYIIHAMSFLIFQTSKRYDFNSVWACVSHAATCHDNHQVGFAQRHLLFCLIMHLNESFNFQKMFGSFFYFTAAKLALYQSIASIVKMKHQVGFQSVAIAII